MKKEFDIVVKQWYSSKIGFSDRILLKYEIL
jgi:hypothetical protein